MGRSIQERPSLSPSSFAHKLSQRTYQMEPGRITRYQTDANGERIHVVEREVAFGIGSGNHAVTYVHRTAQGRLMEMPVSWYATLKGYAMSPGFDSPDHMDFRREISESCLFCHSATLAPAPIDCHRCHGNTAAHLAKPGKGTILNPARLTPQRQREVCFQCHLETDSRGIADSLRKPGRAAFSFQPGEPLADYKLLFDRAEKGERFEINHTGYRLLQSQCFLQSKGAMTCTTCHDPHSAEVRANSCQQCHAKPHRPGDCAACHMPKRVPSDAIHTLMSDHKIERKPKFTNPKTEIHVPYRGAVIDYYTKADPVSLEMVNLREPRPDVYQRMLKQDPDNVPVLVALGNSFLRTKLPQLAVPYLKKALAIDPKNTDALNYLGVAHAVQDHIEEALAVLKQAVSGNPDHSLSWMNLGNAHEALGDSAAAKAAYRAALRLQPDLKEAQRRLSALP
ncbi:MAG: tetratricopeptide repeat protein [Acidobacteria bacterium]|nr:tetratricopeptide repeat protein [Acidobacteriota bacterium]